MDPDRQGDVRRWRRHLADELMEADVYRHLAARRSGEEAEVLLALSRAEGRHAAHWEALLARAGAPPGPGRPGVRGRLLAALARRYGSVFVLALAQQAESRSLYRADEDATPAMAADEQVHEEVVRALAARGRARVSGVFRAAVFGANDGLVSNLSLVLGVIGGGVSAHVVLLTGVSGLLAGALSMGAGEFVSVSSQRELLEASAPSAAATAAIAHLDADANELDLVHRARGVPADEAAARAAEQLRAAPAPGPGAHEPGGTGAVGGPPEHDAAEVVGSGLAAATSSAAFFASGALVPVLPFLAGLTGTPAAVCALVLVGAALLLSGAVVGVLSGSGLLARGLRQLAVGLGAAAVTYLLGLAVGAALT